METFEQIMNRLLKSAEEQYAVSVKARKAAVLDLEKRRQELISELESVEERISSASRDYQSAEDVRASLEASRNEKGRP